MRRANVGCFFFLRVYCRNVGDRRSERGRQKNIVSVLFCWVLFVRITYELFRLDALFMPFLGIFLLCVMYGFFMF